MSALPEPIADTVKGAAARLSLSVSSLYVEMNKGRLKAVKVRGRTLITRQAQADFLAALPAADLAVAGR
jgi:hypothetical protein